MWPCVFVTTDVINEYFGKVMVRRLSILMALFLGYHYFILFLFFIFLFYILFY
jgi:hypothetical protein